MELLIEFLWIILAAIMIYTIYISAKRFANTNNNRNLMWRDIEMYKIKFSEQEIISHLDFIIEECLDYYIAMVITPKNLYYINTSLETEITNTLGEIVSSRISPTLYSQLSLIYDESQIATVVGERIYTKVLEYVIQFNIQNENKSKNKK